MSTVAQLLGVIMITIAMTMMWSPWALVIGGGVLLVGPELARLRRPS